MMNTEAGPTRDEGVDADAELDAVLADLTAAAAEPIAPEAPPVNPDAEPVVPPADDDGDEPDPISPNPTPTPTPTPVPPPAPVPPVTPAHGNNQGGFMRKMRSLGDKVGRMKWFGKDVATRLEEREERIANTNNRWEKFGNKIGLGPLIERVKERGFFGRKERVSQENIDGLRQMLAVQLAAAEADPAKLDQWKAQFDAGDTSQLDWKNQVLVLYLKGKIDYRQNRHAVDAVIGDLLAGARYGETPEAKKKVVDALKMQLRGSENKKGGLLSSIKDKLSPTKRKERKEKLESATAEVKQFFADHQLQHAELATQLEAKMAGATPEIARQINELRDLLKNHQEKPDSVKDFVLGRILQLLIILNLQPSGEEAIFAREPEPEDGSEVVVTPSFYSPELTAAATLLAEQGGGLWDKLKKMKNPFWQGKVKYYANLKEDLVSNMEAENREPSEENLSSWLETFQKDNGLFMTMEKRKDFAVKMLANDSLARVRVLLDSMEGNRKQKRQVNALLASIAAVEQHRDRIQSDINEREGKFLMEDGRALEAIYSQLAELKIEVTDTEVKQVLEADGITPEEKNRADQIVALLLHDKIGSSSLLMKKKNLLKRAGYDLQAIIDLKKHIWKAKQKEKGGVMGWLSVANINVFEFLQRRSPFSISIDRYGRYNATGYEKESVDGVKDFLKRNNLGKLFMPSTWGNFTKDGRTAGWYAAYVATPLAMNVLLKEVVTKVRLGVVGGLVASNWAVRTGAEQYRARDKDDFWQKVENQSLSKKALVRMMKWAAETPNDHWLKGALMKDNQHSKGIMDGVSSGAFIFGLHELLNLAGFDDAVNGMLDKVLGGDGPETGAAASNVVMTPSEAIRYEEGEFSGSQPQPDQSDYFMRHEGNGLQPPDSKPPITRPGVDVPGGMPDVTGGATPEIPLPSNLEDLRQFVEPADQKPGELMWNIFHAQAEKIDGVSSPPASAAGLLTRISKGLTTEPGKWITLNPESTEKMVRAMDEAIQHLEAVRAGSSNVPLSNVEQLLVSGYLGGADLQVGEQLIQATPLFTTEQVETVLESVLK